MDARDGHEGARLRLPAPPDPITRAPRRHLTLPRFLTVSSFPCAHTQLLSFLEEFKDKMVRRTTEVTRSVDELVYEVKVDRYPASRIDPRNLPLNCLISVTPLSTANRRVGDARLPEGPEAGTRRLEVPAAVRRPQWEVGK